MMQFLPITISVVALLFSIFSYLKSNAIANANLELNIYNLIRNSKVALIEISKKLMVIEEDKNKKYEYANKLHATLIEDLVNSYQEACRKYLDNKVDKKRFEKSFKNDIQNLLNDKDVNKIIDFTTPKGRSDYNAILKVYRLWFEIEK